MLGFRRADGSRFRRGRVAVGAASRPGPVLRRRWRRALGVGVLETALFLRVSFLGVSFLGVARVKG